MMINIAPLRLPLSDDPSDSTGNIRLREYQSRLRRCNTPYVLLQAPTSSGKTLAYLTRAIGLGEEEPLFGTTIVVYPTNALIWDQAQALHVLITDKLGKKCNLATEVGYEIRWQYLNHNAEVDLFVLNGESLAALAEERHTSEGRAVIDQLRKSQARSRIILTNPEILFYIFQYKFYKNEELITTIFHSRPPNLLILDEFHLYHGFTLAIMTYMLMYLKGFFNQMIFSSATPIDIDFIINEKCEVIRAIPSDEGDMVRHRTHLNLESSSSILGVEDIPYIKKLVDSYYQRTENDREGVRVLIIVNSLITAARLADFLNKEYPEQVTAIHGLIPTGSRPRHQSQFKSIVVGTSAVEVGVDFNTSSLIVEANNSSSFIQRLGRGARHKDCLSTAFIPSLYMTQFKQTLGDEQSEGEVKPNELNHIAERVLPDLPPYSSFPYSSEAVPIVFAMLLNWVLQRPAGGRRLNRGMAVEEMKKQLVNGDFNLPRILESFKDRLIEICTRGIIDGAILSLAERMSCRSSLESLPAIFVDGMPSTFDYLSLHDLPQVHFDIIKREFLVQRGIKIPWKMRKHNEFLEVHGIREEREKVRIDLDKFKFDSSPKPLNSFRIDTADTNLAEKMEQLLKGNAAYLLYNKEDWRLPGLYAVTGGYVVVGGDAYLGWFIRNNALKGV